MKYLRLYLALLFALVMSVGMCSTALADEINTDDIKLVWRPMYYSTIDGNWKSLVSGYPEYHNGDIGVTHLTPTLSFDVYDFQFFNSFTVLKDDGSSIITAGTSYTISLENFYYYLYQNDSAYSHFPNYFRVQFVYADGSYSQNYYSTQSYDDFTLTLTNNFSKKTHNITIKGETEQDIYKILISEFYPDLLAMDPSLQNQELPYIVDYGFTDPYAFTILYDKMSDEAGLLSGLLQWVKGIFDKIGDTFDVISSGFANIGNWFADLPGQIWGFFENGLKSLFVPSEQSMTEYKSKWDSLLADRLGAVYQVTQILTDSWDAVMASDQTNTIDFPEATISLPDDVEFSFGGYEVQIVPDGFEVLVNAVKLIIGIVATIAFVNGMRRKYDEVMGVET